MKFMVMVHADAGTEAGEMPTEAEFAAMGAFNEELVKAGVMRAGEGLHPSARGARVVFDGRGTRVVDGPFTESKELIAGFWLWECASLDEAVAWARRCPKPTRGAQSVLEIRRVYEAEDFGEALTPELREQEERLRGQIEGGRGPR
ncbi:MAG: YciI family protein [Hydrogenophaga sp.]|uniref:YciI family protein n=1 Tax=Hydrogenophaga crocea TaxID=2716225 RepID=A0A6G8IEB6_9BURK|nr:MULTISPECIES: YciI family protein [Hydrogenophaga]MBL0943923.1 YciI family protein [Hydrogenophaga sp.]QIM51544.1 YciI family protein [Hydrogenophaga crocea]